MANIKYRVARYELLHGDSGNLAAAAKFKSVLVQPGSTYLTENPSTMAGFSALTQLTDSEDVTLTGVALTIDSVRDIIYLACTDPDWTGLTENEVVDGIVIYRFDTSMALSTPYYGIQLGQPATIAADGLYTFPFNSDGIIGI